MNILVIGHSYVVDSNRQFWNQIAANPDVKVDIVVPKFWNSNLIRELEFKFNVSTDKNLNKVIPISCYFKGNASSYTFHWFPLIRLFSKNHYDAIFVFQETWALSVAQAGLLKFLFNRQSLLYLAVCQNIIKKKLFWVIPWEFLITLPVKRIFYCTKDILEVLKWKKIKSKTSYLPFTFDQNLYEFKSQRENSVFTIGYLGRLTEEKGIPCLVTACENLQKEGIQLKLLLAGNGPLKDTFKQDFISYVGPFKHTEAHHFYHELDLFVLPSESRRFWKEQFGRVLVESIASGTPVIGSSSGAIPEVLEKMDLHNVFEEGNAESLCLAIKKIMKEIKSDQFKEKLLKANELNLLNFSHEKAGQRLIATIVKDHNENLRGEMHVKLN